MMLIPFDAANGPYQSFNVNLGEFVCDFRFLWNERDEHWFADFNSSLGGKNVGVRLVEESPLLGGSNALGVDGDFRVVRTMRDAAVNITFENFGDGWSLIWGGKSEWETFSGVESES